MLTTMHVFAFKPTHVFCPMGLLEIMGLLEVDIFSKVLVNDLVM
jgi:hypothetical protein